MPERIEPYSAKLFVLSPPDKKGVRFKYQAQHLQWKEFDEMRQRPGNTGRTGIIGTFAVSPSHQEIHFFPVPAQDTDALFHYSPAAKQL